MATQTITFTAPDGTEVDATVETPLPDTSRLHLMTLEAKGPVTITIIAEDEEVQFVPKALADALYEAAKDAYAALDAAVGIVPGEIEARAIALDTQLLAYEAAVREEGE